MRIRKAGSPARRAQYTRGVGPQAKGRGRRTEPRRNPPAYRPYFDRQPGTNQQDGRIRQTLFRVCFPFAVNSSTIKLRFFCLPDNGFRDILSKRYQNNNLFRPRMHPPRRAGAATRAQENSAPHTGLCSDREARVGAILCFSEAGYFRIVLTLHKIRRISNNQTHRNL